MATTPVFLPGESQGRGSLVGCRLWGRTELDTTSDLAAAAPKCLEIDKQLNFVLSEGEYFFLSQSRLFAFSNNFRISLLIPAKREREIFIEITLIQQVNLREVWILKVLDFPVFKYSTFLYSCKSFNNFNLTFIFLDTNILTLAFL